MRYIILLLLNLPIVLLALVNLVTLYKMKKMSKYRFTTQIVIWLVILVVLVISFPAYNYLVGRPILDAHELSLFDVTQTTVIIYLIYIINTMRRKANQNEQMIRELHQEVSIKLSEKTSDKN